MIREVKEFNPDIVFSPFLKKYIPEEIFNQYPTFLLHPGVKGDKGAYSLEHIVADSKDEWGVVILKVNENLDGGDIYLEEKFKVVSKRKSSIYRNELSDSALQAIKYFFENYSKIEPTPQLPTPLHSPITQKDIRIDWERDTTKEIIKKINTLDSFPGVKDNILALEVELFGAWEEERLGYDNKIPPKTVLAKRDGAICLKTIDKAVWISHLKEPHRFKLPATYVLKDRLQGVKEDRIPLIFDKSYKSFYEISCDIKDNIAYLYFNFLNGAMSSAQSIRLKYAVEYLSEEVDAIVLMGGDDFFSNGIHLNILEDSQKKGEDGWENINAINNLIETILFNTQTIIVTYFRKNAGAGGVFLGLSGDFIVGRSGVVLNPHYKTLGLTGSEYHTYTLPKRVGKDIAKKLLDECLPIDMEMAKDIGVLDEVIDTKEKLHNYILEKIESDYLWNKEEFLEENIDKIKEYKEKELEIMYPEFWEEDSPFHRLRYEFVYKICPIETPKRLKYSLKNSKKTIKD
jgi:putative two-component system hydrogenase maturation factor HypX/HoxX